MNGKLKALGLALVAAFAMSAVVASAASAEQAEFWADPEAVQIDATGEGSHNFFVPGVGTLTCVEEGGNPAVQGTASYEGEAETLKGSSTEYINCHATFLQFPVTVDMNSCNYNFEAGTVTGTGSDGFVEIACANENDSITVTVFGSDEHTAGERICTLHVKGGQTFEDITYTNVPAGVTIEANVEDEIHVAWEDGPGCSGPGTTTKGDYTGDIIAVATDLEGNPVDSEVT